MVDDNILEWRSGSIDFSAGCVVMGILNVTDDSFSDGGEFADVERAVSHGVEMAKAGAAIIDVGAESTRPGSEAVSTEQQIARAIPVIKKLREQSDVVISIDTSDAEVAEAALDAGANMINDVTAMSDGRMGRLAMKRKVPIVLMHMQGSPKTMQAEPAYDDVVKEVVNYLLDRVELAEKIGVKSKMIFIDPGIGFGKTMEHNLAILRNIDVFVDTGLRVLMGTSRKRFIGQLTGKDDPQQRVMGTAATVAISAAMGASIVRVHDVAEMVDVVKVTNALKQ